MFIAPWVIYISLCRKLFEFFVVRYKIFTPAMIFFQKKISYFHYYFYCRDTYYCVILAPNSSFDIFSFCLSIYSVSDLEKRINRYTEKLDYKPWNTYMCIFFLTILSSYLDKLLTQSIHDTARKEKQEKLYWKKQFDNPIQIACTT